MANKKIIYGIGAIGVVATISTAIAIPLTLKKKKGGWVTENGSKVKSLPSGPYYIKSGTTLEDNEFVTDQTKGLGYKKEVKPQIINLTDNKFQDIKKIKVDEMTYNQKEILEYFEIPKSKHPKYKITSTDGTIKYFTTENLAFSYAKIEETNGVGFINNDIYYKDKPKISDLSFKKVTSGFVNSSGDKWQEEQPVKDDLSFERVTHGFVNSSGDKWKEEQPTKDDTSYKKVTSGFVNWSEDEWKQDQPTKLDASWTKWTNYAHGLFLVIDDGKAWWGKPKDFDTNESAYKQVFSGFRKGDYYKESQPWVPDDGWKQVTSGFTNDSGEYSKNTPKIHDASWSTVDSGFKNDDGDYFEEQPKVPNTSWSPVDSGFKNSSGKYFANQPKINDASWSTVDSGFKNDDGVYFEEQPQILDNSWKQVTSGFTNDDGDYFEEQPKVLDNSYYENAEEGSYFNTVNKTYYLTKNEAMDQSGITKVSDPSWTGEKVIIDGEEITPISITAKWWYNANNQKAPEKLYLVNNEFSFTQNIKKAKGYVEGNLPTAQTISSKNKIIIIDGIKYKWVSD